MGFAKAFKFAEMNQLTQPISKIQGLLWLLAAFLFFVATVSFLSKKDWWWAVAIAAILISHYLIVTVWQDAKFGTVANVTILIAVIFGFGQWSFGKRKMK
jgi:hypothetical protein